MTVTVTVPVLVPVNLRQIPLGGKMNKRQTKKNFKKLADKYPDSVFLKSFYKFVFVEKFPKSEDRKLGNI